MMVGGWSAIDFFSMVDDGAAIYHVPHFGDDECEISQPYFKPVLLVMVCIDSGTTLRIVKPVLKVLGQ